MTNKIRKIKKAQEEMVGFAIIIILVSIILVVFLGLSLGNKNEITTESYETNSFVHSTLQYTTGCSDSYEYLSIQKLIIACSNNEICSEGNNSCEILENNLGEILEASWNVGEGSKNKGYSLNISSDDGEIFFEKEGNETLNSRAGFQAFSREGNDFEVFFTIYS
ncbi:MAG: hypothetical protein Q8P15_01205 [Nanoarchaeota archaeon]|nr:hypothetical protein [Nanoarchaeota archaeon]